MNSRLSADSLSPAVSAIFGTIAWYFRADTPRFRTPSIRPPMREWVRMVASECQVADWLNAYVVAKHPKAEALREKWMKDKDRWAARAGWHLTAARVNKDADGLDLPALLDRIKKEMPKAKPEVQRTMNNTLAAIGIHRAKHRKRAIAIGEKIGLYKDWPVSKGCTPPYVPVWVAEMVKRRG